jgi:hypothetical protein
MKRGRGRLNVCDLRCGILELARPSATLAEIAVIEREGDESALDKGAALKAALSRAGAASRS